jgi:hypothetical protein
MLDVILKMPPAILAAIALSLLVFSTIVFGAIVLKGSAQRELSPKEAMLQSELRGAVEVALMTRKHIGIQRQIIGERKDDKSAKYSMSFSQDQQSIVEMFDRRVAEAAKLLNGPQRKS